MRMRENALSNHLQGFVNENVDVILVKMASMKNKIADENRCELRDVHVKLVREFSSLTQGNRSVK